MIMVIVFLVVGIVGMGVLLKYAADELARAQELARAWERECWAIAAEWQQAYYDLWASVNFHPIQVGVDGQDKVYQYTFLPEPVAVPVAAPVAATGSIKVYLKDVRARTGTLTSDGLKLAAALHKQGVAAKDAASRMVAGEHYN